MAADNTRARILETAGEVFAEKGYASATVREICEQAAVNLAAVNYYFGGKESLYVKTLQWAHSRDVQDENILDWPPGTPTATKLRHFIHHMLPHMLFAKDKPWEARLMMREVMNPTPVGSRLLRKHFRKGFQHLQAILDEVLPADMPAHKRHQIGFSIMGQCGWYRGLSKVIPLIVGENELKRHYGLEDLADHITQMSLAALGLAPPVGGTTRKKTKRKRNVPALKRTTQ